MSKSGRSRSADCQAVSHRHRSFPSCTQLSNEIPKPVLPHRRFLHQQRGEALRLPATAVRAEAPRAAEIAKSGERLHYLDFTRGVMMLLGVFVHASHADYDLGRYDWIRFFSAPNDPQLQLSVMSLDADAGIQPAVTIEVDDVDEVHARAVDSGAEIVHPLTDEPWNVRRFFVKDPNGIWLELYQERA